VIIVGGLSVLPGISVAFRLCTAVVQLFPPSRQLLGRVFGRPPKVWANAVFALLFILIGGLLIYLL